jgi:hypothetical protein
MKIGGRLPAQQHMQARRRWVSTTTAQDLGMVILMICRETSDYVGREADGATTSCVLLLLLQEEDVVKSHESRRS